MKKFSNAKRGVALLAIAASMALSACGRDDPNTLIVSARDYQANGDHQAAIIQLNNVLQKQPENGEARLLLGRSSLMIGDAPSAEKEFRKALEFGQPPAVVIPLIATALFQSGSADKVIAEFGGKKLEDPQANAEDQARVGEAYLSTGDVKQAASFFSGAVASDPKNVRGQLGLARLKAGEGKVAEAASEVERIASANPDSLDAQLLLGEIKLATGDRPGARAALQRAVEVSPASPGPRLHLISLLITDNQLDAATAQIAAARAARAPEIPLQYSEALIAYGKKDLAKAREIAQQVLKRAPGHVQSLVLTGAIDFQEKRYAQAESELQSAVSQAPNHIGARALLARSYLATGKPARAVETLSPVVNVSKEVDPAMLMLVGEAHFANGDMKQATALFEKASQSKAQQPLAQMRLGQIAMVSGDVEGCVKKLESVAADEGAPAQADMALLTGYLRQGETAKALDVARAMVKKRPDDPTAHNALGSVLLIRKDIPAARASFTKAVELNPTFMPSVASLAQLDLRENKAADARAR
ncbi:MAG TPA: XrtA/PEP-CTERM system TPR-repeat protein PrsT, partial [Rhizobiaceae bacterium]|nr:XrtA/PEP-CTERM system TPR-repeat protein PrsT [Rhizobiaceae bacterium]